MCEPRVGYLHIEIIAVIPDAQGLGVGSALLEHAAAQAIALGLTEVRLHTNAQMTQNLEYYPRRGSLEVDRRIDNGFYRVSFVRKLAEQP